MKLCKDCQHFDGRDSCMRKAKARTEPVFGVVFVEGRLHAGVERTFELFLPPFLPPIPSFWRCGPKAKHFEPKEAA